MKDEVLWKFACDRRQILMEEYLWGKTIVDGRQHLIEDDPWWIQSLIEDDFWCKTTFYGKLPSIKILPCHTTMRKLYIFCFLLCGRLMSRVCRDKTLQQRFWIYLVWIVSSVARSLASRTINFRNFSNCVYWQTLVILQLQIL